MKHWVVGGAVVRTEAGVLLVRNRRRGGVEDWSTPGGVIDDGESVLDGIAREVHEETGISVTEWSGRLYTVRVHAPDLDWTLAVEVWEASTITGELSCGSDPDGIVVGADFHQPDTARSLLEAAPRWVGEPLLHHIDPAAIAARAQQYAYSIYGQVLAELRVERVE